MSVGRQRAAETPSAQQLAAIPATKALAKQQTPVPGPAQVQPEPAREQRPGRVARAARLAEELDAPTQLSIFGSEAHAPSPLDFEGLLAGPGQVVRMGGTARVSVVVDARWRARVLLDESALRGLTGTVEASTVDDHYSFRTPYSVALAPLGAAWLRGAVKRPRDGFALDGRRLRLWIVAAGSPEASHTYVLRLGAHDEHGWAPLGAALAAIGLPAVLLGPRAGGPAYRITGGRRLAHLAEMIGPPPIHVPPEMWPA